MFNRKNKKNNIANEKLELIELNDCEIDEIVATGPNTATMDYSKEYYSSRIYETTSVVNKLHMR